MLPSSLKPTFDDEEPEELTADKKRFANLSRAEQLKYKEETKRRGEDFKKLLVAISNECRVMQSELFEVSTLNSTSAIAVRKKVTETSWRWLSADGPTSLSSCSRSDVMKYKNCFTPQQWAGVVKTWGIVEGRARDVESKDLEPLTKKVADCKRRSNTAKDLMAAIEVFNTKFPEILLQPIGPAISLDESPVFTDLASAGKTFYDRYNKLEDVSKSYKKHVVLDDPPLLAMIKLVLKPPGDSEAEDGDDGSSVTTNTSAPIAPPPPVELFETDGLDFD